MAVFKNNLYKEDTEENPSYYAILTAEVRYDKRLTPNAKLLYAEITALCNKRGYCWSTNSYFAVLYGVSNTSISKWISKLIEFNYLKSHIVYVEGTKQILKRYLSIVKGGIEEKLHTPIEEKLKDNNTSTNNTSLIKPPKKSKNDFSEEVFECFNICKSFFPEHLQPKNESDWLDTIDKLNRIDQIPFETICFITEQVRQDAFWSKNFLSLKKLRQKNKEGVPYIVVFAEKFKPKEQMIGRQTVSDLEANSKGWG